MNNYRAVVVLNVQGAGSADACLIGTAVCQKYIYTSIAVYYMKYWRRMEFI